MFKGKYGVNRMFGSQGAKIAVFVAFLTLLVMSAAGSHASMDSSSDSVTVESSSTGILSSLLGIFHDFRKPSKPAKEERTNSQDEDGVTQDTQTEPENQESTTSSENNDTDSEESNPDSISDSKDPVSAQTCPSIVIETVQKSSDSAVLQQVTGEKAAGDIRVTWFYENKDPVNNTVSIDSNRGAVTVEAEGETGELKNVSITKLDCGREKTGEAETEPGSRNPEVDLDVNQTAVSQGDNEDRNKKENKDSKISIRFKQVEVEEGQQSPWILPAGIFPDEPNILVKVSTPHDSAYGCIEEGRVCRSTSEVRDNWDLELDMPENKSETIVTIEVYDYVEGRNPQSNPGEQVDIHGEDPHSKSVSLEFSTFTSAASSLTVSGEGDNEGEKDGRIEVELKLIEQ